LCDIAVFDAETIAYAAQLVDDSTGSDSKEHKDGGLLYAISTAHHPLQSLKDSRLKRKARDSTDEQRKIWVPFHFLPGGKGNTFSEKLLCIKNSDIAQEMLENNLETALKKPYGLELMGITAHVYMDTFSHYGFSGISSGFNRIKNGTITFIKKPKTYDYIIKKFKSFIEKYMAVKATKSLGHAGAATYPDRPYLQWQFDFEKPRPDNVITSIRDNSADFLEACKCLHVFFSKFAKKKYAAADTHRKFKDIEAVVRKIISCEAEKEVRIKAWYDSGLIKGCVQYIPETWEKEKKMFPRYAASKESIDTNIYRFHQAATFHRYYILKDLLPAHGIAVY
jgi:hypothetical protein